MQRCQHQFDLSEVCRDGGRICSCSSSDPAHSSFPPQSRSEAARMRGKKRI